jgi:hypothetical protein
MIVKKLNHYKADMQQIPMEKQSFFRKTPGLIKQLILSEDSIS